MPRDFDIWDIKDISRLSISDFRSLQLAIRRTNLSVIKSIVGRYPKIAYTPCPETGVIPLQFAAQINYKSFVALLNASPVSEPDNLALYDNLIANAIDLQTGATLLATSASALNKDVVSYILSLFETELDRAFLASNGDLDSIPTLNSAQELSSFLNEVQSTLVFEQIRQADYKGNTPLHLLVQQKTTTDRSRVRQLQIAVLLLNYHVNVKYRIGYNLHNVVVQVFDVNALNIEGQTALHLAVENNDTSLVELLLESGADPYIRNNNGYSATGLIKCPLVARLFYKHGIKFIPGVNEIGIFDLVSLVLNKDIIAIRKLSAFIDLNQVYRGYTPLAYAAQTEDLKFVDELLSCGARPHNNLDVKVLKSAGFNFLRRDIDFIGYALQNGEEDLAVRLYDSGAMVHTVDSLDALDALGVNFAKRDSKGRNTVFRAIDINKTEVAVELIKRLSPSDIFEGDSVGVTIYCKATATNNVEIVQELVKKHADVWGFQNLFDVNHCTPLMKAMFYQEQSSINDSVAMYLLSLGKIDLSLRSITKLSYMHLGAFTSYRCFEMVVNLYREQGLLLEYINTNDESGYTPLMQVAIFSKQNVHEKIELLLINGAGLENLNDEGLSALDLALEYGNKVAAQALLANGARIRTAASLHRVKELNISLATPDEVKGLIPLEQALEDKNYVMAVQIYTSFPYIPNLETLEELKRCGIYAAATGASIQLAARYSKLSVLSEMTKEGLPSSEFVASTLLCINRNIRIANLLIDSGFDVNAVVDGYTTLALILKDRATRRVQKHNYDFERMLIDSGADIYAPMSGERHCILIEIIRKHPILLQHLIRNRIVQVDQQINGIPLLSHAARQGNQLSVMLLLGAGAFINEHFTLGGLGYSALGIALVEGKHNVAKLLVRKGAYPCTASDVRRGLRAGISFIEDSRGDNSKATLLMKMILASSQNVEVNAIMLIAESGGCKYINEELVTPTGDSVNALDLVLSQVNLDGAIKDKDRAATLAKALIERGAKITTTARVRDLLHFGIQLDTVVSINVEQPFTILDYVAESADKEQIELVLSNTTALPNSTNIRSFIESAAECGVDLACKRADGATLLHQLVANKDWQSVELLISRGVSPTTLDSKGRSVLFYIETFEDFQWYLDTFSISDLSFLSAFANNRTLLMHYALKGRVSLVQRLIEIGVQIDVIDHCDSNVFHFAAINGKIDLLNVLLRHPGVIPDDSLELSLLRQRDIDGNNSLAVAILMDNFDIANAILDRVSDNAKEELLRDFNYNGENVLLASASKDQKFFIRALQILDNSRDNVFKMIGQRNSHGQNAIQCIINNGSLEAIRHLSSSVLASLTPVERYYLISTRNKSSKTPFILAVENADRNSDVDASSIIELTLGGRQEDRAAILRAFAGELLDVNLGNGCLHTPTCELLQRRYSLFSIAYNFHVRGNLSTGNSQAIEKFVKVFTNYSYTSLVNPISIILSSNASFEDLKLDLLFILKKKRNINIHEERSIINAYYILVQRAENEERREKIAKLGGILISVGVGSLCLSKINKVEKIRHYVRILSTISLVAKNNPIATLIASGNYIAFKEFVRAGILNLELYRNCDAALCKTILNAMHKACKKKRFSTKLLAEIHKSGLLEEVIVKVVAADYTDTGIANADNASYQSILINYLDRANIEQLSGSNDLLSMMHRVYQRMHAGDKICPQVVKDLTLYILQRTDLNKALKPGEPTSLMVAFRSINPYSVNGNFLSGKMLDFLLDNNIFKRLNVGLLDENGSDYLDYVVNLIANYAEQVEIYNTNPLQQDMYFNLQRRCERIAEQILNNPSFVYSEKHDKLLSFLLKNRLFNTANIFVNTNNFTSYQSQVNVNETVEGVLHSLIIALVYKQNSVVLAIARHSSFDANFMYDSDCAPGIANLIKMQTGIVSDDYIFTPLIAAIIYNNFELAAELLQRDDVSNIGRINNLNAWDLINIKVKELKGTDSYDAVIEVYQLMRSRGACSILSPSHLAPVFNKDAEGAAFQVDLTLAHDNDASTTASTVCDDSRALLFSRSSHVTSTPDRRRMSGCSRAARNIPHTDGGRRKRGSNVKPIKARNPLCFNGGSGRILRLPII